MIESIAQGIQQYASLEIPVYDDQTNQIKGHRTLTNQDFIDAKQHISDIILAIGDAIMVTANKNPEMFNLRSGFLTNGKISLFNFQFSIFNQL